MVNAPQSAQAQTQTPVLKLGVPLLGPAPLNDVVPHPDVCWAPGTPTARIAAYNRQRIDHGPANSLTTSPYQLFIRRWSRTATNGGGLKQGQPTTLTYSFPSDGLALTGLDQGTPNNLQARLTQIYGSKTAWLALFDRVGKALGAQSGLTYVYEPNDDNAVFVDSSGLRGVRGDIRVVGHRIDGNSNVLAYNYSPDIGDMVIDTADNFYDNRQGGDLGFRNTITHEFGHGVGLGHTCPANETKLMEPFISFNYDGPQFDDVRGLQRLYGDKQEDNDTAATAIPLGSLGDGTVDVSQGRVVSIDDVADQDFFSFSFAGNKSLSLVVAPVGTPYLEGPQTEDCSTGTTLDPKLINDLGFELLKDDGQGNFVTFSTTNTAAIGATEVFNPRNFPTGGIFRVRVFGGNVADVQTYSMRVIVGPPVVEPTPVPSPTTGPTPTPGPTALPTATPQPVPTAIRPVVDLNGPNEDGSTGQDSPNPNGIDNVARYFYRVVPGMSGGAQLITPPSTIVVSDISDLPGRAPIVEARVELTPDAECGFAGGQGTAPDNCNPQGKRDNEVLTIKAEDLKALNDGLQQNIGFAYDNNTQVLTINGGQRSLDERRNAYEAALSIVRYENKLPIAGPNPFNRDPRTDDRIITYVVDTDTDATNNQDDRFGQLDGPGSNPLQSKPAVLTLSFLANSPLIVTTTEDPGPGGQTISLRDAILYANLLPTSTTPAVITFAPGVLGTINLSSSLPQVGGAAPITIQGPGASKLTIDGSSSGSAVLRNGFGSTVVISGLTITGGNSGGVQVNRGNMTLNACMISGNNGFQGGGVSNFGGSLTVTNSTISGNNGGGISSTDDFGPAGNTVVTNSTISGNSGSGLSLNSNNATTTNGNASVTYSTITRNTGGGLVNRSTGTGTGSATITGIGVLSVYNSIVSGNTGNNDVQGTGTATANRIANFTSAGYNIIGAGTAVAAFTPTTFDRTGIINNAAGLATLGNNGGETKTHALFSSSPAIDTGAPTPVTPPTTDQRGFGFPRVFNTVIDVGAFERQNNAPVLNVAIAPVAPRTNDLLRANIVTEGGANAPTSITYEWVKNGTTVVKAASPDNTLDLSIAGNGDLGDTITVNVIATNASGTSRTSDTVTVVNTPPTTPTVVITATNPAPNAASTEVLTRSVLTATPTSTDADNEQIGYAYQWSVNGVVINGENGQTLDLAKAGNGDRDDEVSVRVTAFDATDVAFRTGSASVTVRNTPPVAQNVAFNVKPGETVRVPLAANDDDAIDTNFTFTKTSNPTLGTATIEVDANGRSVLVYTANADAIGTDTLTFTATDSTTFFPGSNQTIVMSGSETSANATATANIQLVTPTPTPPPGPTPGPTPPSNRPPVGANTSLNTQREIPVSKALAISDPDAEDTYGTLNVVRVSGPRKGTGEIRKDADGVWKLFYKASGLFKGNDEVKFVVIDSKGAKSGDATITINLVNTKPTVPNAKMTVIAGGSASVGIFGQDIDRDTVTFQRVGGPSKGSGEFRRDENGNFRFYYQNNTAAVGNDQVQFVALDGQPGGVSQIATIEITVVGVFNRAPSAQNVSGTTTSGTPVAVAVAGTDPDEGDVLTFRRVGGPNNGTGDIRQDEDGTFKMFYTPSPTFVGTETIRYVAFDQKNRPSAPATITITVTASAPSAAKSPPATSAGSS